MVQVPHRRRANVQWKLKTGLFGAKPALAVETSSSIRKGEELSMDYGPDKLDNAVLLDYGVLDTSRTQVNMAGRLHGSIVCMNACLSASASIPLCYGNNSTSRRVNVLKLMP